MSLTMEAPVGSFAVEHVKAYISRNRVSEMLARGWTILGPGGEGMMLMEGPDPDDSLPEPLESLVQPLVGRAWLQAMALLDEAA